MTDSTLTWRSILGPTDMVHLTRATLTGARPTGLHDHDFYELIWVQNGQVRHHLPDGKHDLSEGDVLFIRPRDRHALQGRGSDVLVVSVTLHPDLIDGLTTRFSTLKGHWFWSNDLKPIHLRRDSWQMADLNHAALRLDRSERDALAAEAFLLPLLSSLREEHINLPAAAPAWLAQACAAAADPRVFRDGAAGFARVAGRAHPHVSRTARRFLNQSPSDYINTRRMDYAARQLSGTGDTLTEIAADCGIPNLSHFHKLFRAQHGLTPAQYRRTHQKDVVQPA